MFDSYDDVLTAEEGCEALKIGYNAMYELLNTGKLKGYRNGRMWRIPKAALVEFIQGMAKMS
jgi:excisionase family DNA binding protein